MKQLITIKTFKFDSAHYRLDDGSGDQVVLNVDYKNNQFHITGPTPTQPAARLNPAFRQEIAEIAADLLSRKHGVNFASKSS